MSEYIRMPFNLKDRVTHIILRWSGNPSDETPLCGADKDDNFNARTIYPDVCRKQGNVICSECERQAK